MVEAERGLGLTLAEVQQTSDTTFRLIASEPSLETCGSCPGGLLALSLEGEVFSKTGSTRAQAGACLHASSIDALDFYRRSNPCLSGGLGRRKREHMLD